MDCYDYFAGKQVRFPLLFEELLGKVFDRAVFKIPPEKR